MTFQMPSAVFECKKICTVYSVCVFLRVRKGTDKDEYMFSHIYT